MLRRAGLTVACAESLTGGALVSALVDVPGASAVVRGGLVDAFGAEQLGGEEHLVERFGQAIHAPIMRPRSEMRQPVQANLSSPPRAHSGDTEPAPRSCLPVIHARGVDIHREAIAKLRC